MRISGNAKQVLKMPIVQNVWLKICSVVLLLNWASYAGAIRTGEHNTDAGPIRTGSLQRFHSFENYGTYEHRDNGTQTDGFSINSRKLPSLNVPQDDLKEQTARNDSDLAFRPHSHPKLFGPWACNFHEDLHYTQDAYQYLPDGMPIFHVTFTNTCLDRSFCHIHIECENFESASFVNPNVFRRLAPNDCLLNNGGRLGPQDTIAFEYSSTFEFPMIVYRALVRC